MRSVTDNTWLLYPTTASTVSYTANSLNQYAAVSSMTPTYDGNGNLTYDRSHTHCYDAEYMPACSPSATTPTEDAILATLDSITAELGGPGK
ncbi:MAG TPA: hypothetical protein VFE41_17485 [Acetobacteraceae bacterium]|nr:hypothetical protein [Acetobacteraceae bacterium]